jgi:hypothetical protein
MAAAAVLALHATLFLDPSTVEWLNQEDGLFEYLGALGLLVTALLFAVGYLRLRRSDPAGATGIWKRRSLILLCLVFLIGAGEEISWGQRILGISTPEGLAGVNAQRETNLHNLYPVAGTTWLLFLVGWYTFVIAVPLLAALKPRTRDRLGRLMPLVPLPIAALFLFNYVVSQAALFVVPFLSELRAHALDSARILDGSAGDILAVVVVALYPISRGPSAEVQELVISLLAVFTAWTVLSMLPGGARTSVPSQNGEPAPSPAIGRSPG